MPHTNRLDRYPSPDDQMLWWIKTMPSVGSACCKLLGRTSLRAWTIYDAIRSLSFWVIDGFLIGKVDKHHLLAVRQRAVPGIADAKIALEQTFVDDRLNKKQRHCPSKANNRKCACGNNKSATALVNPSREEPCGGAEKDGSD